MNKIRAYPTEIKTKLIVNKKQAIKHVSYISLIDVYNKNLIKQKVKI